MDGQDEGFRRRDKFPRERPSLLGDPRRPLSPPAHWRPPPSRPLPRAFPFPPPSLPRECPPSLLGSPPTKRARGTEREMTRAQLNKPERKPPKTGGSDGFQPVIMTFKAFLATQDDAITDEEAAAKYGEYKCEFRRQQLNEFFVTHKAEEWFKEKYHPLISRKREEKALEGVKKRLEVFQQLETNIAVTEEQKEKLEELLDKVVVRLEGGTGEEEDLHKTSSIFLKCLPASITREEVEAVCSKFPGFLRLCISAPDSSKKWQRRAWVSYRYNTKVREICYSLNNTRIRGFELGSLVNKPLSQRIRTVAAIHCDSKVARGHLLIASRLVGSLDTRRGLWSAGAANPVVGNIKDLLVEEVAAEEEELLGAPVQEDQGAMQGEEEPALLAALDRLILYLRIVHSVDFYTGTEYSTEEEMPNRCGLLHARATRPESLVVQPAEVKAVLAASEAALATLLQPTEPCTEAEAAKLGLKNEADELEKFMTANCQEVAQDKWLCPLSGKKFKGPEFIRKHIVNKFPESIEEVKQDTGFFNNYLRDPGRPELPIVQAGRPPASQARVETYGETHPTEGSLSSTRKRSVHDRLGRPGEVRVTQAAPDPRDIVDYSDIDLVGPLDIF